jgi:transmembrane sensor
MSDQDPLDAQNPDELWQSVARSMAGEGTPEERAAFRAHLDAHPERAELVDALEGALRPLTAPAQSPVDVEAALARVMARRDSADADPRVTPISAGARPRAWTRHLLPLAAALVMAVGGTALWRATGPAAHRYATEAGEWRSVSLPDGSRVRLGPVSRLTVERGYGRRRRTLALQGEGFFQVSHGGAPFVVRAPGAVVRDIGTAFTLRTLPDGAARVVVTEGTVALSPGERAPEVILRQGDRATVAAAGEVGVERGAATDADLAWTRERLVFRDATLAEAAEDLSRWYGLTVLVPDEAMRRRRVTASFQGESAEDALALVAAAVGADLQRGTDTVRIVPRR